jgi:hypothetical protein
MGGNQRLRDTLGIDFMQSRIDTAFRHVEFLHQHPVDAGRIGLSSGYMIVDLAEIHLIP